MPRLDNYLPGHHDRRTVHRVRIAGVIFLVAASLVFFFGLGGSHSHGELFVAGADGEVLVPGSNAKDDGDEPVVPAGALTFRLANASRVGHEFAVFAQSAGGEEFAGLAVAGMPGVGGSALDLPPGAYRIVCTTPGHESQGMSYNLRVE